MGGDCHAYSRWVHERVKVGVKEMKDRYHTCGRCLSHHKGEMWLSQRSKVTDINVKRWLAQLICECVKGERWVSQSLKVCVIPVEDHTGFRWTDC